MPAARWITGAATGLPYFYDEGQVWGVLDADLALGVTPERVYSPTIITDEEREQARLATHRSKKGAWLKNNNRDTTKFDQWAMFALPPKGCDQRKCKMATRENGAPRACGLRTCDGSIPPDFHQRRRVAPGIRFKETIDQPAAGVAYYVEDHARGNGHLGCDKIQWSTLMWIVRLGENR